jgi:hypothetical protein
MARKTPSRNSKAQRGVRERTKVAAIVAKLPGATAIPTGQHLRLEVRKRLFGWFMVDHHGDGRVQLNCKGTADLHEMLYQLAPHHFHVPAYVGNKGWIGLWLDVANVDWKLVEHALRTAYGLLAPKTLIAQSGATRRRHAAK